MKITHRQDEWNVGDRVEGGKGEDYDTGTIHSIDEDQVTVSWDSGVRTTQPASIIRLLGE